MLNRQPEELESTITVYNPRILNRARLWLQLGQWEELAALDQESLKQNPNEDELRLLAALGYLQKGGAGARERAKGLLQEAIENGADARMVARILVGASYNTLARLAALTNRSEKSIMAHFRSALRITSPNADVELTLQPLVARQLASLANQIGSAQLTAMAEHAALSPLKASHRRRETDGSAEAVHERDMNPSMNDELMPTNDGSETACKKVKLYGPFRSGTNYIRALLEWNFYAEVIFSSIGGWKHGLITDEQISFLRSKSLPSICMIKHPLSALLSWFNYYKKVGLNIRCANEWHQFLVSRFIIFDAGNTPVQTEYRFASPIEYWNASAWNLLHFTQSNPDISRLVKYESLLESPAESTGKVAAMIGLNKRTALDGFEEPDRALARLGDVKRTEKSDYMGPQPFDKAYYLEERYIDRYSDEQLELVASALDKDLLEALNYRLP